MPTTIIVTDLTRFKNENTVCTAGIDPESGVCIRPMPYLALSACKRLKIFPGGQLIGDFKPSKDRTGPHQEDHTFSSLKFSGPCSSKIFKQVLAKSSFATVAEGFEAELALNQKLLPPDHPVQRSIITIQVDPSAVEILEDQYEKGKIKLHFRDSSDHAFRYFPITDLGFHSYAMKHHGSNDLDGLNEWVQGQSEVYLRIGLGRRFKMKERDGFWMQANGIYTFPDPHPSIRKYSD
jgi:hypothetical protein